MCRWPVPPTVAAPAVWRCPPARRPRARSVIALAVSPAPAVDRPRLVHVGALPASACRPTPDAGPAPPGRRVSPAPLVPFRAPRTVRFPGRLAVPAIVADRLACAGCRCFFNSANASSGANAKVPRARKARGASVPARSVHAFAASSAPSLPFAVTDGPTSQINSVASSRPETRRRPSGENVRCVTSASGVLKRRNSRPSSKSHTRISCPGAIRASSRPLARKRHFAGDRSGQRQHLDGGCRLPQLHDRLGWGILSVASSLPGVRGQQASIRRKRQRRQRIFACRDCQQRLAGRHVLQAYRLIEAHARDFGPSQAPHIQRGIRRGQHAAHPPTRPCANLSPETGGEIVACASMRPSRLSACPCCAVRRRFSSDSSS